MKAYKLMRLRKDGSLGSLFINRKNIIHINEWLEAESHKTNGFFYRPFWHCTTLPEAPHLSIKNRVWVEVEVDNFKLYERPKKQGGIWILAEKMKVNKILNTEKNKEK